MDVADGLFWGFYIGYLVAMLSIYLNDNWRSR